VPNTDIDAYIRGLNYDPRVVLSVVPDGDITLQAVTTVQPGNNEVIVCKSTPHTLTKNLSEVAILSQGVVAFPGALLIADSHLQSGAPTPIALPAVLLGCPSIFRDCPLLRLTSSLPSLAYRRF
jgi:thiol-activated cytolysin